MEEDFEGYSSLWAHKNLGLFFFVVGIFDAHVSCMFQKKIILASRLFLMRQLNNLSTPINRVYGINPLQWS